TQVVSRLGAALDAQVPVRTIFEASTVAGLALRVEAHAGTGGRLALVAQERPEVIPASLAQQRMWVINRIDPTSAAYNIPVAIRLSGLLDVAALGAAVRDVVDRHEVLHTKYPDTSAGPSQVIVPSREVIENISPIQVSEADVLSRVTEVATVGFDVTRTAPVRVALFELSPTEHVLVVVVHHISGDAFSIAPLTRDLVVAYSARVEGESPRWAPLPVQYADYSLWQRKVLGSENDPESVISRQLAYWSKELAGIPEQLALPTDRPRPARPSMRGGTVAFTLPSETVTRIGAVARDNNSTVFMVIHSALAVLLSRLSGATDIAVGTPVAGRGERVLDDLVGMFVNTLVLRTQIDPSSTFVELLTQAREKDLAAFGNADIPFERLVEAVGRERSSAYTPLFQVMLTFQNTAMGALQLPGLEVSALEDGYEQAKFDLQLTAVEQINEDGRPGEMQMYFTYASDLFSAETVELFAARFVRIVEAVTEDPSVALRSIDILTDDERHRSVPQHVKTVEDLPDLVAAAAEVAREAIALSHDGRHVTYGELFEKFAAVSKSMGAALKPEALVSVALAGLFPGILPALGVDGYAGTVETLIAESQSIAHSGSD
ncbi:condensation domain-containing protein, partial [Rhodococcus sp. T7]|uniref:condensation domain-containing protein n=1 Tax=Rhodococcus sp. T7 TaxID=627444 RepID=UPI001F24440F